MRSNELSYAEKLMTKKYQFTDMLIRATDAVECGALSSFTVNNMDHSDKIGNALYLGLNMTYHAIENEIKGIEKMMDENKAVEQEVEDSTFNDLIDKAVVAYKDGVLGFFEVGSDGTSRYILATHNEKDLLFHDGDSSYSHAVEYINSLYNETFMIESQSDLSIIKLNDKKTKVKLANGEIVNEEFWDNIKNMKGRVQFLILKGATVTQQKGNK